MKVNVYVEADIKEERIDVRCKRACQKVDQIVQAISNVVDFTVLGSLGQDQKLLTKAEILYFESVDKKCFAYTLTETYEVESTLSELEDGLGQLTFARINKSTIVNLLQIEVIKSDLNMRTITTLKNKEKLIVSRHYKKSFNNSLTALRDWVKGGHHAS